MNGIINYDRIERNTKIRNTAIKAFVYFFLAVWALIVLFPFYWMILSSVKEYGAYNSEFVPKLFTLSPTLENLMGLPVTALTDKQAPPLVSPSSLVKTQPVISSFSLNDFATFTAS